MGAERTELHSRIAVPGLSRLSWSGLVRRYPTIRQARIDIALFPEELVSTCLYSLRKPWISWRWLRQAFPVRHWSGLCHELMERGQTCNTGRRSLRFAIDSWLCQGIGESCCKILLSTIFQLFRTCSSGPSPPLFDEQLISLYVYRLSFFFILQYNFLSTILTELRIGSNLLLSFRYFSCIRLFTDGLPIARWSSQISSLLTVFSQHESWYGSPFPSVQKYEL